MGGHHWIDCCVRVVLVHWADFQPRLLVTEVLRATGGIPDEFQVVERTISLCKMSELKRTSWTVHGMATKVNQLMRTPCEESPCKCPFEWVSWPLQVAVAVSEQTVFPVTEVAAV
jgi:hypothetical protein